MKIKNFLKFTLLLIVLFNFPIATYASSSIPNPTEQFFVNDFAQVFTEEEKANLVEKAANYDTNNNGIQVVITTIPSIEEGEDPDDYATRMYNQYGIGQDDMGVLVLLVIQSRDFIIRVGRTMEVYITDAEARKIIRFCNTIF